MINGSHSKPGASRTNGGVSLKDREKSMEKQQISLVGSSHWILSVPRSSGSTGSIGQL